MVGTRKADNIGLQFPNNYTVISSEEMTYLDGGSVRVDVRIRAFLRKSFCQAYAGALIRQGSVRRMSTLDVAKELFAHAFMYHRATILPSWIRNRIQNRAGIADITDGGDTWFRRQAYNVMWAIY